MPNTIPADAPLELFVPGDADLRPIVPADFLSEKRAILELAAAMADAPAAVLPSFVALAAEMSDGVSAGLSLFEPDPAPGIFRWRYVQGPLSPFENSATPRRPGAITLAAMAPVVTRQPERYDGWIADANIIVPEVLMVPLYLGKGQTMGTLWIIGPTTNHFTVEHARIAAELAAFAGVALKMARAEEKLQAALEDQEMLTHEMSHRVKNLFAVSEGMVRMAQRTATGKDDMGQTLIGRFHALASAHALIRGSFSHGGTPKISSLNELVAVVLEPHERPLRGGASRIAITGPMLICGERALNSVALLFHELATNALKYGALGNDHGRVALTWVEANGIITFDWRETGGPALSGTPELSGFGSKLLRDTVTRQMGGTLDHTWDAGGLHVRITVPTAKLTH